MKLFKSIIFSALLIFAMQFSLSSCSKTDDPKPDVTEGYTGQFPGTVSVTVAGSYTYSTDITVSIVSDAAHQNLNVTIPSFSLADTMMGDLTLGEITIPGLVWDKNRNCFLSDFGNTGLTQHFKAVNHGITTMNTDYPLNDPSQISVSLSGNGILTIQEPFKLGEMPFPLYLEFVSQPK